MGPPDFLAVDQGKAYVSVEMKSTVNACGVRLEEAPIENPGSIGVVERYHAPLRTGYTKIRSSLYRTINDEECLQMAVFANNSTMGPEGPSPMLLVHGALPLTIRNAPSPTQLARNTAIDEARRMIEQEQSRRRVKYTLRHPSSPKAKEMSKRLRELPEGSPVLVYRTHSKRWEGPYRSISVEGEAAVIQLERTSDISKHMRQTLGTSKMGRRHDRST